MSGVSLGMAIWMFEFLAGEKKEHYQHFEHPHPIKNEISLSRAKRARVCFFARNAQRLALLFLAGAAGHLEQRGRGEGEGGEAILD